MHFIIPATLIGLVSLATVSAGPITYGLCQTACNVGLVVCVVAITGMTMGPGAVAAAPGCSLIQGACMASCAVTLIMPTP